MTRQRDDKLHGTHLGGTRVAGPCRCDKVAAEKRRPHSANEACHLSKGTGTKERKRACDRTQKRPGATNQHGKIEYKHCKPRVLQINLNCL